MRNNIAGGFAAFNKRLNGAMNGITGQKNPSTMDLEVSKLRPRNIR